MNASGPPDNPQFDAIATFHVIEHVDDPSIMLREIRNRLKDDGILAIDNVMVSNSIEDISALANLTALERLELEYNRGTVEWLHDSVAIYKDGKLELIPWDTARYQK